MNKEVYIFGAGASHAAADTPLGNELGWYYFVNCSTLFEMTNDGGVSSEDLAEKRNRFSSLEKLLEIAGKVYPELSGEIDRYLNDMKSAISYRPTFLSNKNKKYFWDEMLSVSYARGNAEAVRAIKEVIYAHIVESYTYRTGDTLYDLFLERKIESDVTIISLNFDNLLEENYDRNICIDYLIDFDEYHGNRGYKKFENCFSILKLQCSFDWAWCNNCGMVVLLGPWLKAGTYNGYSCAKCKNSMEPFIIVPHDDESKIDPRFEKLWGMAEKALKTADEITFIGYSIPEYDIRVVELLKTSLNKSSTLRIVDPQSNRIKNRLVDLGIYPQNKPNNAFTEDCGFKEYLSTLRIPNR